MADIRYKSGDWPKALVVELKKYEICWLKPHTPREKALVEKIVLEKVFQAIPLAVRAWLTFNGPSLLVQASTYLKNYFLAERAMRPDPIVPELGLIKWENRARQWSGSPTTAAQ